MKKNLFILLIALTTIFAFSITADASQNQPPTNLQEALTLANQELRQEIGYDYFTPTNSEGRPINFVMVEGLGGVVIGESGPYGALVYGDPHGDANEGQNRYLGYTILDEDFTNPAFPHDAWAGGYLEDRNWIATPWGDERITSQYAIYMNDFDNKTKYLPNIQKGIAIYYADVSRGGDSSYWNSWSEYVHILVPPTKYTWGMGRRTVGGRSLKTGSPFLQEGEASQKGVLNWA